MSYGGDVNRGPFLNVINWVFCSITLSFVTLRLISARLLEKKGWQIDDGVIVLSMALVLVRAIYVSICIDMGFGQHLEPLLEENPVQTLKLTRLMIILEAISLWTWTLPKIPVAMLIVRVFGTYKKALAWVFYSLIGLLVSIVTVLTVITFSQCNPVAKNWNPMLPGRCWDPRVYLYMGYFAGALSAGLDFGFAIYPTVQISKLQIDTQRKVLIAVSLGLGIPAGITTCYKISTISALVSAHDPTWATVPLEVWNSVESCALIIAAAVPIMRPVIVLIGKSLVEFTSRMTDSSRSKSKDYIDQESGKYQSSGLGHPAHNSGEILLEEVTHDGRLKSMDTV